MMRTCTLAAVMTALLAMAGTAWSQTDGTTWSGQEPAARNDAENVQEAIDLIVRENDGKREIKFHNFQISFGMSFLNAFNTEIRIDHSDLPLLGTRLRLEDDLGFDSKSNMLRIDASYSFNRYHRIDVSWFDINRDSTAQTTEEIRWEDYVIPPTKLDLKFNTTIFKIAYRYNFVVRDDWEVGASLGIHWLDIDTGFRVRQAPAEGEVIDFSSEENLKQGIPLPVIGLHGNFYASDDWRIFASFEAFWAKIGDYSGRIADIRIGVDWMFIDWLGVGLYYNFFSLDVEAKSDDWRGEAEYSYQGLILSLNFAF